jgi:hypothetical protein
MSALHVAALAAFEPFRAPLRAHDLARRLAEPLKTGERAHLDRWGYPYVLDAFRFHFTLTARLAEGARSAVFAAAAQWFDDPALRSVMVDGLCLFMQPDRSTPFRVLHRAAFGTD